MTCRHSEGDPACGSTTSARQVRKWLRDRGYLEKAGLEAAANEIDDRESHRNTIKSGAEILDMRRVGANIVLRVKPKWGTQAAVLVFLGVTELDLLKWSEIPTELDGGANRLAAKFPAGEIGWGRALKFAADPDFKRGEPAEIERSDW